ncbi:MAG: hypothetical protein RBU23_02405 [Candidatus Auribacterota bacterium]|jgi:hypothetical protein|nr:hypothetical protein [Candidatus Auribacterota bacterium]
MKTHEIESITTKESLLSYCKILAKKYDYISEDLEKWIDKQELYWESVEDLDVCLEGLWSSYKRTKSYDAKYLTEHKRMFVYDVALAHYVCILRDLRADNFTRSKKTTDKIAELLAAEERKGSIALLHFSYSTSGDRFIDPYLITGSNIWIFKSLYAYMLHSGDLTHFNTITGYVTKYLFPLQILDENHKVFGLIKAGYVHKSPTKYGYDIYDKIDEEPPLKTPVPLVVIEHSVNFVGLLRLMASVIDAYSIDSSIRDILETRHAMTMQAIMRLARRENDKIYWPSAIKLDQADGVNWSYVVDHYTWLAAMFIGIDPQIEWDSINILMKDFTAQINSIEIKEMHDVKEIQFIDNRFAKGLIFFSPEHDDFYIDIDKKEEAKLASIIQPEATAGGIISLYHFAVTTPDNAKRGQAAAFMAELLEGLEIIHGNFKEIFNGQVMGMPYATRNIQNYFTSLPSMASTATFFIALETIRTGYRYFIGIPMPDGFDQFANMEFQHIHV